MAHTFVNISFETVGGNGMEPDGWVLTLVAGAEQIADYDTSILAANEPWENMEQGWRRPLFSVVEPFDLEFGETVDIAVDGAAPQTATVDLGEVLDVDAVTAAEMAAIINTDIVGVLAIERDGQVLVFSDDDTAGASLEVTGGTAVAALGFSTELLVQEENGLYKAEFIGAPTDLDDATFNLATIYDEEVESYENRWAGLSASFTTTLKEPYALTDTNTLDVSVDGAGAVTVTFNTIDFADIANATADEVRDVLNTALGLATATSISGIDVTLSSDSIAIGSSIEITGGTDAAALGFPALVTILGNEAFIYSLSTTIEAIFDSGTPETVEDFEEEWGSPDNVTFIFTFSLDTVLINTAVEDGVYTITVNGTAFNHTADDVDTTSTIASSLAGNITAGSAISSAVSVANEVRITPDDGRTNLVISITEPATGAMEIGTQETGGSLTEALFDVTMPEGVEDFEEEWLSNQTSTTFLTTPVAYVNASDDGNYTITLNGTAYTHPAVAEGVDVIAAALEALIDGGAEPFSATSNASGQVIITPDSPQNPFTLTVAGPLTTSMLVGAENLNGSITALSFDQGGTPESVENFEETDPYQVFVKVVISDAVTYDVVINGVSHEYTSPGVEALNSIRDNIITAIVAGSQPVEAVPLDPDGSDRHIGIRSTTVPVTTFALNVATSDSMNELKIEFVDKTADWSWDQFLRTI